MKYEVRKNGKVYMKTEHKRCQYTPKIEKDLQEAGYDIYIDGKRQPRRKLAQQKITTREVSNDKGRIKKQAQSRRYTG